jgi:hypothetical protein
MADPSGHFLTSAIIRIPALNFVAPVLRNNPLVMSMAPVEANIFFLVDTGADVTCISALDANKLRIEMRYLELAGNVIGIGGKCGTYRLTNIEIGLPDKVTQERINFHIEELDFVYVIADNEGLKMPSLLGLDILRRFDIQSDRQGHSAVLKRISGAPGNFRITSQSFKKNE